jgi:hypothetical protein
MHKEITQIRGAQLSMQRTLEAINTYLKAQDSREVYEANEPYWDEIRQLQANNEYDEAWERIEAGAPKKPYPFTQSS